MLCPCGKKLIRAGTDNGCHVLVCPVHSKKSYRIPVTNPLPFPWESVGLGSQPQFHGDRGIGTEVERNVGFRAHAIFEKSEPRSQCESLPLKVYICKECKKEIDEVQAKRTFEEEGRALCLICEGREHGIEIMGFESP